MTFKEKFKEYLKDKIMVEIITKDDKTLTGIVLEVEEDFATLSHAIEREISVLDAGQKSTKIEVLKLETSLLFSNVSSVSKIVSKIVK